MIFTILPSTLIMASELPVPSDSTERRSRGFEFGIEATLGEALDELSRRSTEDGYIYRYLRVQSDYTGTVTYRVPVPVQDLMEIIMLENSIIQPFGDVNPFNVTRIMYSGLSHEDSIVIVLLSDGFDKEDEARFLAYANNVIWRMIGTHPFGEFWELFTVYAIHTYGDFPNYQCANCKCENCEFQYCENPYCEHSQCECPPTILGYLGSIRPRRYGERPIGETTISGNLREVRVRELANSVVSPQYQTMIHVISNAGDGSGWAWPTWDYLLHVNVGVTSI